MTCHEDCKEELKVLIDALDKLGCKGEVKISEWMRGSKVSWKDAFDKSSILRQSSRQGYKLLATVY